MNQRDNEDNYYEVDKDEMDISISRDYLLDFNDIIEDNDSSGIFKDFLVKSDTNEIVYFRHWV